MVKIIRLLDDIGFFPDKDGTYIGRAIKEEYGKTRIEFKNHVLTCTVKDDISPLVVFSFIYGDAQLGTFIFLLQEFGIISFDFVYQHVVDVESELNKHISETNDPI
jgi:hypothetical protein